MQQQVIICNSFFLKCILKSRRFYTLNFARCYNTYNNRLHVTSSLATISLFLWSLHKFILMYILVPPWYGSRMAVVLQMHIKTLLAAAREWVCSIVHKTRPETARLKTKNGNELWEEEYVKKGITIISCSSSIFFSFRMYWYLSVKFYLRQSIYPCSVVAVRIMYIQWCSNI
jgi:hypothetical protein